eukprot:1146833-Pelagomonas_calceolata.AAC.2
MPFRDYQLLLTPDIISNLRVLGGVSTAKLDGHVAVESRRRRALLSKSMADNPPVPHYLCFWLSPRLAASSLGLRAFGCDPC